MPKKQGIFLLILMVSLIILWATVCASADKEEPGEVKVAMVNGTTITQDAFNREIARLMQQIASSGGSLDDSQIPSLKNQAMNNIIGTELLYQESLKKGIKVGAEEIEKIFEETKEEYQDKTEWDNLLKEMNISESGVRTQIERGLAVQQFINRDFVQKVSIPDEEAKAYYDSYPERFSQQAQVRASHILISVSADDDESKKKEAWDKIQNIKERLNSGEDFEALAKEFSQCPSSENGGDLGYFSKSQMVEPFSNAAFAMEIGEVSDVVKTQFGYHIIKLTDKMAETRYDFESVKENLKQLLMQYEVNEMLNAYISGLREKAEVEILLEESP